MDFISVDKTFEKSPYSDLLCETFPDGCTFMHRDQYYILSDLYSNSSLKAQKIHKGSVDPSMPDDVLFDKVTSRYLSSSADAYQYHKSLRQEIQNEKNFKKAVQSLSKSSTSSESSDSHSDEKSE